MKCIKILAVICIVVAAVLFYGVANWGIPWLENQIGTQLLRALPEGSTVGKVSYSPFGNSVTIEELKIPNPPGYSGARKAVVVKRLYADLNVRALFRRVIYLESLEIGPVDIQLELKKIPENFDELLSAEWIKSGCNLLDLIQIMTKRTPPDQVAEKPEQIAEKPEPVAEKPEQLAETPEQKTVEKPEQVAENPEQVAEKPEQVAEKPEQVAEKPEQVAENPEQVAKKPEQVAENPEQVAEKPEEKTDDSWKLRIDKLRIDSVRVYFPNLKVPQDMEDSLKNMVLSLLPSHWKEDERYSKVVEAVCRLALDFAKKKSEVLSLPEQGIKIPRYEQRNLGQDEKTSCSGVVLEIAERHWTYTKGYAEFRLNEYLKKMNTNLGELKKKAQKNIEKAKEKVEKAKEYTEKGKEVIEEVQEFIDKNPEVKEKVDKAKDKLKDWWKKRSSKR